MTKKPEVVARLKELTEEHGGILQPQVVVDDARSPESVLHSEFTWDDSEAAEKFRLIEARQLINVVVEYIKPHTTQSTPVFVSLRKDRTNEGGGYRPLAVVLKDSDLRAALIADCLEEMRVFQRKYKSIRELASVFAAMEVATETLQPSPATSTGEQPAATA